VGNLFTSERAGVPGLMMSNGATVPFVAVLLLAGSHLAGTRWERELASWLAERDQMLLGLGCVGFDLDEIAWDPAAFPAQREFALRTVDLAIGRHRWDVLGYDPPFVPGQLGQFRELLAGYGPAPGTAPRAWRWRLGPPPLLTCPVHDVYEHAEGCNLCHND
jgi:hypothetical protein